ncbi:toll/interleukin-1 receptor domain-containing protein [Marinagarivorans cellulosilyticus]|uniref:TIR domain-containing protein n=1 Tax=Marinagarivorans cellulosilyticus TaxID=2721545 RepID=A0AAN1WJR4_9GAMM|nr:toll/interleukin-1 receptor domain-containing protein [Marinagarivorans cellulosilyticus]BCD98859.1 hypothetical protein MARGE09_P3060 [Marinagarivorans cellulosilyticus]
MPNKPLKLFYSYSHADSMHRLEMEKHLVTLRKAGRISEWSDNKITAGKKIGSEIRREIAEADIVVFLISVDFLNSEACLEEVSMAKELFANGSCKRLIAVILRDCAWMDFDDMGDYLALPYDGKPVECWPSKDIAWSNVFSGLRNVIEQEELSHQKEWKI